MRVPRALFVAQVVAIGCAGFVAGSSREVDLGDDDLTLLSNLLSEGNLEPTAFVDDCSIAAAADANASDGSSSDIEDDRASDSTASDDEGGTVGVTLAAERRWWLEVLLKLVWTNQIVQAFLASTAVGAISYTLLMLATMVFGWLRAKTFSQVTIHNSDETFNKVIEFIGKQGMAVNGALVCQTMKKRRTWRDWKREFMLGKRRPADLEYLPANNNDVHVIYYSGKRIMMHRSKGETVVAGHERKPLRMETLTLSGWGADNSAIKRLIDDAVAANHEVESDNLNIYTLSSGWPGGWERALSKAPRPLESVILDEDIANRLIEDARHFLDAAEWYAGVGIPYRRGYLLHGPPGCGKTSFCQALAGALKLDLCILTLSNKDLTDNELAEHMREAPASAIVLLEDVDAVFVDRAIQAEHKGGGVTFSGLLNALDGVASQEGRLFFMTTNHKEKLDPALIRPGRCDVDVELQKASRAQAVKLFERFFPGRSDDARRFGAAVPDREITMAQLQGHLLKHKTDAVAAVLTVDSILGTARPKQVELMPIREHLARVGLEQWAHVFEARGYCCKADTVGLDFADVEKWSWSVQVDSTAAARLKRLLSNDSALLAEYQLVDTATAKDMFMNTFARPDQRCNRAVLSRLGDQLCRAIQRDAKSRVSIWQLRQHLRLHYDDPEVAADRASRLVLDGEYLGASTGDLVDGMSARTWLARIGLERHATRFERAGYQTARSLLEISDNDSMLKELAAENPRDVHRLKALKNVDKSKADLLLQFVSPDRRALAEAFRARFGSTGFLDAAASPSDRFAYRFADELSDPLGQGMISRYQLRVYLASHADDLPELCCRRARAALLESHQSTDGQVVVKRPGDWLVGWLSEHGLQHYANVFHQQHFRTVDDFCMEPSLGLNELGNVMGIQSLGEQRKLLGMIEALRSRKKGCCSDVTDGGGESSDGEE